MRVLLVSPYGEKLIGGIATWTKYVVDYHREHGGDIDLRLLNNANPEQVLSGTNLFKRLQVGIKNYLPVCREFKKLITREQFDVAHICSSASFGLFRDWCLVRDARKKGIRTCLHMHFGRIPSILKSGGWERFVLLRLFRRVDCIVVMDRASFLSLKEAGFNNVRFLPNPLSSKVQQLVDNNRNAQREPRKIVFAGHVGVEKGVFELVKACREISDVKLELLGKIVENDVQERLRDLAGKDNEGWLSIPGNKTQEEVIRAMMTCSVFVLPSHSEGFPNVILESMACGCPIVATYVGAIPEMLAIDSEKPCGICVPVNDVTSLRSAIVKILDDTEQALEFGANARTRVTEQYSMPNVWSQMVGIWKTAIN